MHIATAQTTREEHPAPAVHIVDDDRSIRTATARFLRAAGCEVRTYANASEFLGSEPHRMTGCVILEVCLDGSSGFDVQQRLAASPHPLPVVFLSGRGEIPDSVRAMRSGAVDFLTKPTDGKTLLDAVARAMAKGAADRAREQRLVGLRTRYARLSARECEVFAHLISGQLNKQIGFDLGISEQTIKIHRHRVLRKMEVASIAELVRIAIALGVEPIGSSR
jgi:FixJ family two-component response regulator